MKKILIVDDDLNIQNLLKNRLAASDYAVVTAGDGDEGLKLLESESPDLVIVDILMPKMDGFSFVRALKRREASKKTPVIVLSAKDQMRDLFELEGVTDYFVKPYRSEELLKRIESLLSG